MHQSQVSIRLPGGSSTTLQIFAEKTDPKTILEIPEYEQRSNNEAAIQLLEGCSYEFKIESPYQLQEVSKVITNSKIDPTRGRIIPGNYVGSLVLQVLEQSTLRQVASVTLEVRSSKLSYREDYRNMLEDISEYATELLMQYSSPVTQAFTPHHKADATTLYQRFAFIKSVATSEEFQTALHRIIYNPVTGWQEESLSTPFQAIRRVDRNVLKQIASGKARFPLPANHPLQASIASMPAHLTKRIKTESVDIPENQFVKYILQTFANFCEEIARVGTLLASKELQAEATALAHDLQTTLHHSLFSEISPLRTIPLNSPIMQRREGYREVLRAWLLFDLAARLIWSGGDDVYAAGKRDVAVLYEYWIFFKLLGLMRRVFKISFSPDQLVEKTPSGLNLKLKQGRRIAISGILDNDYRTLNVEFNYNKSFKGGAQYPRSGSWTKSFRPDYTLSLWPGGISSEQAETEELIVHIHFDAKYRIDSLQSLLSDQDNPQEQDEDFANYQRTDLLKMHAYRDAIRRTAGAYILYPGEADDIKRGFHEILPGLGAFAIRPGKTENGEEGLENFLREVLHHLLNRASNRERVSYRTHQIHSHPPLAPMIDKLPEPVGKNRALLPSETFVLVGYFKNQTHLDWIEKYHKYNIRTGTARGAMHITSELTAARYLLLYTAGDQYSGKLFGLRPDSLRFCSRQALEDEGYPTPRHEFYLLFDILPDLEDELSHTVWDFPKLSKYSEQQEGFPFTVTLEELMRVKRLE